MNAQIVALKRLRRQSANLVTRAYNVYFESTRKRSECPFEVQIRHRRIVEARESLAYVVACLRELLRQKVLQESPYKPGDRIRITYDTNLVKQYLVVDLAPKRQGTGFYYVIWELTKQGNLHKGRHHQLHDAKRRVKIELVVDPTDSEVSTDAQWYREGAIESTERSLIKGDLTMFRERNRGLFGEIVFERQVPQSQVLISSLR